MLAEGMYELPHVFGRVKVHPAILHDSKAVFVLRKGMMDRPLPGTTWKRI